MNKTLAAAFALMIAGSPLSLVSQTPASKAKPSLLDGLKQAVRPVTPAQQGPQFQMAQFQTKQLPGQETPSWTLDLSASEAFNANYYTLSAAVKSASGQTLATGNSIALRGSAKNQVLHLTQPYQKLAGAAAIQFSVLRYDGQNMATKVFQLPTTGGSLAGANPAGGVAAVLESGPVDPTERLEALFDEQGRLVVRNQGERPVLVEVSAKAEFAAGISKRIPLNHVGTLRLAPGDSKVYTLLHTDKFLPCPTLTAFHAVVRTSQDKHYDVIRSFDPGDLELQGVKISDLKAEVGSRGDSVFATFRLTWSGASLRPGSICEATFRLLAAKKPEEVLTWSFEVGSKGYAEIWLEPNFDFSNLEGHTLNVQLLSITTNPEICCGNVPVSVNRIWAGGSTKIQPQR